MVNNRNNKQTNNVKLGYLIILLLAFSTNFLFAQEVNKSTSFSHFSLGVYGGINFNEISEIGGTFYIEKKQI